jgi:integrase
MAIYRPTYRDPKTGEVKESKVWWFEFIIGESRFRESTKQRLKTRAKEVEAQRRREIEEKGILRPQRQLVREKTQPVAEALTLYAETYQGVNGAWVASICRMLARDFAGRHVADLTEDAIKRYRIKLEEDGYSPRTVNIRVDTLARALGRKFSDLWPSLKRKREPKSSGRALSAEEKLKLLEAADANKRSPFVARLIRVALLTGLRAKELRTMQWGRVYLAKGYLMTAASKSEAGERRLVPINDDLDGLLRAHLGWFVERFGEARPDYYLFPSCVDGELAGAEGKQIPMDPTKPLDNWQSGWDAVREEAGVRCRWHDLRHTFISDLAAAGVPESQIRAIVGHVDDQILRRYIHVAEGAILGATKGLSLPGVPKVSPKVSRFRGVLTGSEDLRKAG